MEWKANPLCDSSSLSLSLSACRRIRIEMRAEYERRRKKKIPDLKLAWGKVKRERERGCSTAVNKARRREECCNAGTRFILASGGRKRNASYLTHRLKKTFWAQKENKIRRWGQFSINWDFKLLATATRILFCLFLNNNWELLFFGIFVACTKIAKICFDWWECR